MKLLVIDSDRDLVEMLTSWLKMIGYEVYRAYTVERAKTEWIERRPDMVILDTTLNGVDLLSICNDLRKVHDALLVVMSNDKDVQDEVRSLDAGADDYLHKPFFPSQLLARIRAVSRRGRTIVEQRPSSIVIAGPLRMDSLRNEVTIWGKTSRLTPTESKMLHFLAVNANDVCTTEQIVTHVWGYGAEGDASLIKAHIRHLRQKIEPDASNPRYIVTVPNVGYSMVRQAVEDFDDMERPLRAVSM